MATAEAAQASLGPRYASDDPTLPQPWKGSIDGSTGFLYYWNPETNVTQYEKPTALPPPFPPGPPPAASTPTVAPISGARTTQTTDVQSQQMMQSQQQHMQQLNPLLQQQSQVAQQQSSQIAPSGQQQSSLFRPAMQHHGQMTSQHLKPQMMRYLSQQMPSQLGQGPLQHGSQVQQQTMQQTPQQLDQQNQTYQCGLVGNPQSYPLPRQQAQYMPYQQSIPPQGQQSSGQHTHQVLQGQQYPHQQDQKSGFQQREDAEPQLGKQVGFSPAHQ